MAKNKNQQSKRLTKGPLKRKETKLRKEYFEAALFEDGFWKRNLLAGAIIFIIGLGLYLRAIPYDYVLDDQIVITKNIYTAKGFGGIWEILSTESFQGYFQEQKDLVAGARYRPLSIVTFAMEYEIMNGFNRQVSHFINALLYGLCGLLLFRILSLMFRNYDTKDWFLNIGFWAALMWVVHPLHTEAVANIKGRDEIMSLIGALGALYYSLKYVEKGKILNLVLASIAFFLGLLSKETPVTFLGVIPLTIYFFQTGNYRKHLQVILPLTVVFIIYIIIRYQVIGYLLDSGNEITDLMNNPFVNMNFGQKYATIFYTLLLYLKLLFIPYPLTHDYYPFHIPTMEWSHLLPILSLTLYLGLGLFGLWGIKRRNVLAYASLFYIMTLSIVSNIVFPIGTFMNERFLFMPSIAFGILVAYIGFKWVPKISEKITPMMVVGLLVGLTVAYSYRTFTRIPAWKNTLSLNSSAIKVSKNSARANVFMGTALFNQYKEINDEGIKRDLLARSESYLTRAKELFPDYYNANMMLAGIYAEKYRYENDFDQLLEGFKYIASDRANIPYLFEYYEYLDSRGIDRTKLMEYFYDIGKNVLIDKKYDYILGIRYLEYAQRTVPNNEKVLRTLAETYEKIGNSAKAQSYYNLIR